MKRDRYDAISDKQAHIKDCESKGMIADSKDVRESLIVKMKAGESTLEEIQAELKKIKRNAKKSGQKTRAQAWREG